MRNFWEKSTEYQRQQEIQAEFEAARKTRDEAGREVLLCVASETDTPRNSQWLEARRKYLDAQAACYEVSERWRGAYDAFEASPAGKAMDRYFADPLAVRVARGLASYAPAEFAEAAE